MDKSMGVRMRNILILGGLVLAPMLAMGQSNSFEFRKGADNSIQATIDAQGNITGRIAPSAVDLSTVTVALSGKLSTPTVSCLTSETLTTDGLGGTVCQPASSAAGLDFVFIGAASDISGYRQMVRASEYTPASRSTTTSVNTPPLGMYLSTRASNAGFPGINSIPAGSYHAHFHALASNSNRFKVKPEVYIRPATGGDIEWIESTQETPFLTTTETEYDLYFIGPSTNILITNRIVYKLKVTATGAGTISIFSDGTGTGSNNGGQTYSSLELPSSAGNYFPVGAIAPKYIDLSTVTIALAGKMDSGVAGVAMLAATQTFTGEITFDNAAVMANGDISAVSFSGSGSGLAFQTVPAESILDGSIYLTPGGNLTVIEPTLATPLLSIVDDLAYSTNTTVNLGEPGLGRYSAVFHSTALIKQGGLEFSDGSVQMSAVNSSTGIFYTGGDQSITAVCNNLEAVVGSTLTLNNVKEGHMAQVSYSVACIEDTSSVLILALIVGSTDLTPGVPATWTTSCPIGLGGYLRLTVTTPPLSAGLNTVSLMACTTDSSVTVLANSNYPLSGSAVELGQQENP
jgi:hypothetical protein